MQSLHLPKGPHSQSAEEVSIGSVNAFSRDGQLLLLLGRCVVVLLGLLVVVVVGLPLTLGLFVVFVLAPKT